MPVIVLFMYISMSVTVVFGFSDLDEELMQDTSQTQRTEEMNNSCDEDNFGKHSNLLELVIDFKFKSQ